MRKLGLVGLLAAATTLSSVLPSRDSVGYSPTPEVRRPLDLPSGGRGDDEEEDAPETITFYGTNYEGDAFVWCLDTSDSMNTGGKLGILKANVNEAIGDLSDSSEFGIVHYNNNHTRWQPVPRPATAAYKGLAQSYVNTLAAEGQTCTGPAGIDALALLRMSDNEYRRMILVSDGVPICGGVNTASDALADITGANTSRDPIDTVYIGNDAGGQAFMQQLAAQNNGTFNHP